MRTDDDRRQNPICQSCIQNHQAKGLDVNVLFANCHGIYEEVDFQNTFEHLKAEEQTEYLTLAQQYAAENYPHWEIEKISHYAEELLEEDGGGLTLEDVRCSMSAIEFHKKYFSETRLKDLRPRQEEYLACTSRNKAVRFGRRGGKSTIFSIEMVYMAVTTNDTPMLYIVPNQAQVMVITNELNDLLAVSEIYGLLNGNAMKQPYWSQKFMNGSEIKIMIASGEGKTIRGQKAHKIYLDETDYIPDAILREAVLPILIDNPGCGISTCSTPSGERKFYYRACQERDDFREFFAPSWECLPHWTEAMRKECLENSGSQEAFDREYGALFGESDKGVFRKDFLIRAQIQYSLPWPVPAGTPTYLGVDWNGSGNGTRIIVLAEIGNKLRLIHHTSVTQKEFTTIKAIETIVELNRLYKPLVLTIDRGFGAAQDELLRKVGQNAIARGDINNPDVNLLHNLITVDFSEKLEFKKLTRPTENDSRRTKVYMVENLNRLFESDSLEYPESFQNLYDQFDQYRIKRFELSGQPIYEAGKIGDHDLDALMLAAFGFAKKHSPEFGITRSHPLYVKIVSLKDSMQNLIQDLANKVEHTVNPNNRPSLRSNSFARNAGLKRSQWSDLTLDQVARKSRWA